MQQVGGAVGLAALVTLAARRSDGLAGSVTPERAATEGFSFALTVAAVLLVLGASLVATLLGKKQHTGHVVDAREAPAAQG